jgi:hypothetical protein
MTPNSKLSDYLLEKAGWFSGRSIDILGVKMIAQERNLNLSIEIEKFLIEFDKINFEDERCRAGYQGVIDINFDYYSDVPEDCKVVLKSFGEKHGVYLIWIGESDVLSASILISPIGEFWVSYLGLDEDSIFKIGDWGETINLISSGWRRHLGYRFTETDLD